MRELSYRAHDGHTDQMRSLTLAAALARSLRRELLLPPLMHHLDAVSCPSSLNSTRRATGRRPRLSTLLNLSALGVRFRERDGEVGCQSARSSHGSSQHCVTIDPTWLSFDHASDRRRAGSIDSAPRVHFASLLFS